MIDIHHHILPDIDDGPREWDEAVENLRCVPARERDATALHWSEAPGGRALVEVRQWPEAAGEPGLSMEDLLEVLNT